jgi:dienelactone hydrolase
MRKRFLALVASFLLLVGFASVAADLSIATTAPDGTTEQVPTTLSRPDGPGPFPAIVLMHDCSGLGPASSGAPGRWAKELVQRGYVVVLPDSFTTRGHAGGICTVPPKQRRGDLSFERRARDAYAALAWLRAQAYVDPKRVGLMGGSHGGATTLAAILAPAGDAESRRGGFAAAVALYPRCQPFNRRQSGTRPLAPLFILIGEKDDWTPAEPCRRLAETAQAARQPVTIKIYPGAHHSFDSPNPVRYVGARVNPSVSGGYGATTGGDPAAWADSIREVEAFFGRYL